MVSLYSESGSEWGVNALQGLLANLWVTEGGGTGQGKAHFAL